MLEFPMRPFSARDLAPAGGLEVLNEFSNFARHLWLPSEHFFPEIFALHQQLSAYRKRSGYGVHAVLLPISTVQSDLLTGNNRSLLIIGCNALLGQCRHKRNQPTCSHRSRTCECDMGSS